MFETQEQGGVHVYLYKVEFSDKNTRAYTTITNQKTNGEDLNFYDFNAKAIQGNHQFGTTSSFDVEYPKIRSDIPPGIKENGVILFEPLDYTQSQAKIILPVSVGLTNEHKFTFDVNLSNNNINKHPQFVPYENFDYKIKVACPNSWKNGVISNAINFSLSCSPPDNNLIKALIGIQSTMHFNYTMTAGAQKQHLSSILSDIKNNKRVRIINSSYTTISNNSALQVLDTFNNTKNLERHTVTSDGYYTIVYSAAAQYFNKYLPIAQKVMDLLQIGQSTASSTGGYRNSRITTASKISAASSRLSTITPINNVFYFIQ